MKSSCPCAVFILVAVVAVLAAGAALAAPPAAPANLSGISRSAPNASSATVIFSWEDRSDDEAGFVLELFSVSGGNWFNPFGTTRPANATSFTVSGPFYAAQSTWRVRAFNAAQEFSDPSNEFVANVINGSVQVTGHHRSQIGEALSFTVTTPGFTAPTLVARQLPDGVGFDPATGVISGTPTGGGFSAVTITATEGMTVRKGAIGIAVIDPPVVTSIPAPGGAGGTLEVIDLRTLFDDPDTETTAVIKTNLGDIPLTLFDTAAPITTNNFKGYIDRRDWNNTIIHRSIANFVLQGGWLHPQGEKVFTTVPSAGPIADEYDDSRPNVESTFSMAKNDPNAASTNWFISLKDNSQNLDFQAGGFASFARVIGDGMAVLGDIEALQTGTYTVTLDGIVRDMTDLPLTSITAESPLDSQLVIVSSIERIEPLRFEIVSNSNPGAVTASLTGRNLGLGYAATQAHPGGESTVTVAATDLDGARTELAFTATSYINYATWARIYGGGEPQDNTDGGTLDDLQDYAFGGDPQASGDDPQISPSLIEVQQGGDLYDAITFSHRRYAPDLSYTVQTSSDLVRWTDLWTSADGLAAEPVAAVEESGNFWKLSVRGLTGQALGEPRQFFRVLVSLSVGP